MTRFVLIAAVAAALAAFGLPAAAPAVVPPKSCGTKTIKGQRYQIKADQITCRKARRSVKRFIKRGVKPSGYTCKDYESGKDRVDFYCNDGRKVFFAIRR